MSVICFLIQQDYGMIVYYCNDALLTWEFLDKNVIGNYYVNEFTISNLHGVKIKEKNHKVVILVVKCHTWACLCEW